ncbi:MAG TPA: amidohydrolase, partial [Myxococcaceae bacterium]|nr:amidohydrolase [Myxococcaceae bacterium]
MNESTQSAVYVAAKIRTLDAERPEAEALAVAHGRVLAVGSRREVLEAAGPEARVVELPAGAVMVPGLADAHAHLSSLGRTLTVANLKGTKSVDDIVERLRAAGPASRQGDWLVGRGWDQNDWAEGKRTFPDRAVLDAAFPDVPVFLTRIDGHAAWVNSEALRRAGVTRATKEPQGGRILRRQDGEPTGVLVDNAIDLVEAKVPAPTNEQLEQRMIAALKKCAAVGLTSIHDAGMDLRNFELLQRWDVVGLLPLRVYAMADGQGGDRQTFLERGTFKGRMLEMRSVKFWLDGALGSRGAALHAPYSDDPGNTGLLLLTPEELESRARAFMEAGFQVNVHAIGDRANTLALDVLERATAATGTRDRRHRLEHAQVMRREDIARLSKLGVVASMQPTHATSDMPWAEARVGPERIRGGYAWRTILDSGAIVAFGSDFPVEEPDPLLGLYAARTRQDAAGNPADGWYPNERVSGEEALRAFTVGAAYASFAEGERGMLEPGLDADFVALSV